MTFCKLRFGGGEILFCSANLESRVFLDPRITVFPGGVPADFVHFLICMLILPMTMAGDEGYPR